MRALTRDLSVGDARPYFLWDEDISIDEFRARIASNDSWERERLIAKLLREASDLDVWKFVKPGEVAELLPRIERRLGKRAAFWRFLIEGWKADGLL